jgi:predicted membrane channel-forming protein YqfA (hemolysin III family)
MIERIDKMDWLDVIELIKKNKPVEDVDEYLNYVSKWPLFIHLIAASICLFLSATYHLFFVYSPEASLMFAKLDYTGIVILFFGSTVPFIQYSFACNEVTSMINLLILCFFFL